jgi:Protein of unknown function (DUF2934)
VRFNVDVDTLTQRIRTRANELWRQDGSLEGCADEYWRQARELVELEAALEAAVTGNGRAEQNKPDTAFSQRQCKLGGTTLSPSYEVT